MAHFLPRTAVVTRSLPNDVDDRFLVDVLAHTQFLRDVPREKLEKLNEASPLRRIEAGQEVVRQGDFGHSLFVLVRGVLRVHHRDEYGEVHELVRLSGPGEYFGELAMLGRRRRAATVEAVEPTLLIELEKTRVERLDMICDGVLMEALEKATEKRSIRSFVDNHTFLKDMAEAGKQELVEHAAHRSYDRGKVLFRAGEPADTVLLIRSGVCRLVRKNSDGTESVLAYFNAGDAVGLGSGETHGADLVAMGRVEAIACSRPRFARLEKHYPRLLQDFGRDVADAGAAVNQLDIGATGYVFIDSMLRGGVQEGLSVLTINLDVCVRCGNCVRACQERHGHARVTRKGKKLVRRVKADETGKHETLLVPASCRHCVNPECMIGCPTGAIHRRPGGEVDVKPTCIGCGSCANKCPYGNITMVPTEGTLTPDGTPWPMEKRANKCNLCAGYAEPNCVHNCPTGAILRVEPTSYFEELSAALGKTGNVPLGRTEKARPRELSKTLVPLGVALFSAALLYVGFGLGPYSPWSPRGMALGTVAAMLGATALAGRRRLMKQRDQYGLFRIWTRVHYGLGALALVAVVAHSNGRGGGVLTQVLLALTALDVLTGVVGRLWYWWLPKRITRIEGDSQVEEDVRDELEALEKRERELLADDDPTVVGIVERLRGKVGGVLGCLSAKYDPDAARGQVRKQLEPLAAPLPPPKRKEVERMAEDLVRRVELRACLWLYAVRKGWLATHVGASVALVTLIAVHIAAVVWFSGSAR